MSLLAVQAYEFVSGFRDLTGSIVAVVSGYIDEPTIKSTNGLFRRAFSEPMRTQSGFPGEPEGAPNGRFAVAFVTGLIAFLGFVLVQYTFKIILTLAIVESPPAVFLSIESEDLNERNRKPAAVLGADTPRTYVTDSIRGTIKHLRTQAGPFALWRGWWANLAYVIAHAIARGILTGVFGSFLPTGIARPVAAVLGFVALTRFSMTCTHIIISTPQPGKTWFSRLFSTPWSTARHSLPAMAHFALINTIASELCIYGVRLNANAGAKSVLFILGLFVSIFVSFPAMVALVRVQASLLPDSQEAIVSFDRSFGKSDSMAAVTFKGALKSVGCAGWKRIYKVAVKIFAIATALAVVCVGIVGLEMIWVMAGAPKKEIGESFSISFAM